MREPEGEGVGPCPEQLTDDEPAKAADSAERQRHCLAWSSPHDVLRDQVLPASRRDPHVELTAVHQFASGLRDALRESSIAAAPALDVLQQKDDRPALHASRPMLRVAEPDIPHTRTPAA